MKKLLSAGSFLCLALVIAFLLRVEAPAQAAQQDGSELGNRVSALELALQDEKRQHEETRALLAETLAYLDRQAAAAEALLGALDQSEEQGFAIGENWRSRETLLAGMRAYWGNRQDGLPKVPVAPKAPAPTKQARPARQ